MNRRTTDSESQVATQLHPFETTQLPPEICELICGLVDRKTLLPLGKVSRVFYHQAQRGIYRTVDLLSSSYESLVSWCRAVNRDPRLGVYLHSLTLGSPSVEEAERLVRVLKKCPNLKRLALHSRLSSVYSDDRIHTWVIDKAPFRLTHFTNSSLRISFMSTFWNKQTDIRFLSLPLFPSSDKRVFPCHEDQLPNLETLEVSSTKMLPTTARPLKRIQLRIGQESVPRDLTVLRRFAATLTTFNLWAIPIPSSGFILSAFSRVAEAVPNLLHLGIAELIFREREPNLGQGFMSWIGIFPHTELTSLRRLKSFVFYTYYIASLQDAITCRNYALSDPKSVADRVMEICPNLEEVIIGGYNEREVDGNRVRKEDTCKLIRDQTTRAVSAELGTKYDFDAVGRF